MHVDGSLRATTYGLPCSVHMDPIEKKPLFHFLPGTGIFSVATVGCNLHCRNCQNDSISQANPEDVPAYEAMPEQLIETALEAGAKSIAYTYTEPLVFYEYTLESCRLAQERKLNNVLVTAGFINNPPLRELLPYVDAANVDLKAFNDKFYKDNCDGSLRPVLQSLETFVEMGVWLEITNLIIPTLNDGMKEIGQMCKWIRDTLGPDVPLHFSRFHPHHRLTNLLPTPAETLENARDLALDTGLRHVYVGNLRSRQGEHTFCPNSDCSEAGQALVRRNGYRIVENRLNHGCCPICNTPVAGLWEQPDAKENQ
jgi:pyruvate formate lyase activating enzyme